MTEEKILRGVLRSEVDRSVSKDNIIIVDSLNNIKVRTLHILLVTSFVLRVNQLRLTALRALMRGSVVGVLFDATLFYSLLHKIINLVTFLFSVFFICMLVPLWLKLPTILNLQGYRYELWCLARAAGIRYCVVSCDIFEVEELVEEFYK